jgi:GAF domain-containing protein
MGDTMALDLLSSLSTLHALSIVMAESGDEDEILRAGVSSVASLSHRCRPEAVWLDGAWRSLDGVRSRVEPGRGLDVQIAALGEVGGVLHSPGAGWAWAFPLSVGGGSSGYLVVGASESPPEQDQALMQALAQQTGVALANARLLAKERATRARIADEHGTLRRVASLVAETAPPEEVFTAVAAEAGQLLQAEVAVVSRYDDDGTATVVGSWARDGGVLHPLPLGSRLAPGAERVHELVFETRHPARVDGCLRDSTLLTAVDDRWEFRSFVGAPIGIAGRLWGQIGVGSIREGPLPPDTEVWLAGFTELVAAAIANAEAHVELRHVAEEQAALRRVATMVARAASPDDIFAAVSDEVDAVFGSAANVLQFESDGSGIVFAGASRRFDIPVGTRWPFAEGMASAEVHRTGRAARVDAVEWSSIEGSFAEVMARVGVTSSVACPIVVEDRLWGAVLLASDEEQLPPDTENRLAGFTELVATAIANAASREALRRLADEQAALRRAATLVVEGVEPAEIFSAVSDEVGRLLGSVTAAVGRFEADPPGLVLVGVGSGLPDVAVGQRSALEEGLASTQVRRTGRSARVDARDWQATGPTFQEPLQRLGLVSTVASPIVVEGRLWGTMNVLAREPLPPDTEQRLERFSELLATAIANAKSREALALMAEEQAALRGVATLVAQGVRPSAVFSAVSEEIGRVFGSDAAAVVRFEADPPGIVVVGTGSGIAGLPIGTRAGLGEGLASTEVYRTGRSARVDHDWHTVDAPFREPIRRLGVVSTVASPIVVEGRLWGATSVSGREPPPPDTEERLEKFSELVAMAIANAEAKSELEASRRRIVTASDEVRRRIERDLHDGTQQRLVSLALAVRGLEVTMPPDRLDLQAELSRIATGLSDAVAEFQEISRGIHPEVLTRGGLGLALRAMARRSAIPVELHIAGVERLPQQIEVAAYYAASEALANASKHSRASHVEISLAESDGCLRLSIDDDGIGGVTTTRGSGLVGLGDRVEALGGSIQVRSQPGEGTQITVELPLMIEPSEDAG